MNNKTLFFLIAFEFFTFGCSDSAPIIVKSRPQEKIIQKQPSLPIVNTEKKEIKEDKWSNRRVNIILFHQTGSYQDYMIQLYEFKEIFKDFIKLNANNLTYTIIEFVNDFFRKKNVFDSNKGAFQDFSLEISDFYLKEENVFSIKGNSLKLGLDVLSYNASGFFSGSKEPTILFFIKDFDDSIESVSRKYILDFLSKDVNSNVFINLMVYSPFKRKCIIDYSGDFRNPQNAYAIISAYSNIPRVDIYDRCELQSAISDRNKEIRDSGRDKIVFLKQLSPTIQFIENHLRNHVLSCKYDPNQVQVYFSGQELSRSKYLITGNNIFFNTSIAELISDSILVKGYCL